MAIDIVPKEVSADDMANKEIVGRTNQKTIRLILFGTDSNANWAAERALRRASYPFLEGSAKVHQSMRKYEVGDLFLFSCSEYNISNMVCRIMMVDHGDLESDSITISFMEEVDYVSDSIILVDPERYVPSVDWAVVPIDPFYIVDAPYDLIGDNIELLPLVGRMRGTETGYILYMSHDDVSYHQIKRYDSFCIHGVTTEAITRHFPTNTDKRRPITVDLTVSTESLAMEDITREDLMAGYNKAILFDGNNYGELISFADIQLDSSESGRVHLYDVVRSQGDTLKRDWPIGTDFFFIRSKAIETFKDANFYPDSTHYFKLVPFSNRYIDDIADAITYEYTVTGRGKAPYPVGNLKANGIGLDDIGAKPSYTGDIVFTWSPAYRGTGAGLGDPDSLTDSSPTWEGHFEMEVWVSSVLVRTVININSTTWTYTSSMNTSDNGALASELQFKLRNYIYSGGIYYKSEPAIINVYQ